MQRIYFTSATINKKKTRFSYYIEGQLATPTKTGQPWKLYNIRSQGISFTDNDTIYGHDTDKGVQLVFDHAATTHPQGFDCGMKFYRWQNNSGRWQVDSEVEDAQAAFSQQKVMSIMLVLDCSSSIGSSDFVKLKNAAKQFIDVIIDKSSDGNVHIGIVGFNSMRNTRTFDLRPLTKDSRKEMFQFIDTLQLNNRTAFYYAINKGLDNIKSYVAKLKISKDKKYDGNYVIAFTDGYDNDSFDPKIGKAAEGTEHRYFQHVNQRILKEKIGGAPKAASCLRGDWHQSYQQVAEHLLLHPPRLRRPCALDNRMRRCGPQILHGCQRQHWQTVVPQQ